MNRSELRALVIQNTGRSDKTSLINSAINIALKEISSAKRWSDLLTRGTATLTANTGYIDLASDLARLDEVRLFETSGTTAWDLEVRRKSWLTGKYPNPEAYSPGKPVFAYLEARRLYLYPIPDAAYPVRYTYYKIHADLSSDSSSSDLRFVDQAVIAFATAWVFQSLQQHDDAKRWFGTYAAFLASAKGADGDNSAVKFAAESRPDEYADSERLQSEYWLDPFSKG
jgi:hypothetical protein